MSTQEEKLTLRQALGRLLADNPEEEIKETTPQEEVRALRAELSSVKELLTNKLTPGLKRSKMTAREKAVYIGEHGKAKYFEIPWD